MANTRIVEAIILAIGFATSAWIASNGMLDFKQIDRSVEVKGLAEREVSANIAILPIVFSVTGNDLAQVYSGIEARNQVIVSFLQGQGFKPAEISASPPSITDRQAQDYGNAELANRLRYTGKSVVTVYSRQVEAVRKLMPRLVDLGRQDIAINTGDYENRPQFLFTDLNALKPSMIEEATRNGRLAAEKFAKDSDSKLGKIRRASQGQFSIEDRDQSTPYIKKVRVVSTIEYYLAD